MEGQVFVPYTGIGGANLNGGLMTMGMTGSSDQGTDPVGNPVDLMFTVSWQLPGGIVSRGTYNEKAAWGYILGRGNGEHKTKGPFSDEDFCTYLTNTYSYVFDLSYNPTNVDKHVVEDTINDLVGSYLYRVLVNDSLVEGYDFTAFRKEYGTCMDP